MSHELLNEKGAEALASSTFHAPPFTSDFCWAAAGHLRCAQQHAEHIKFLLWAAAQAKDQAEYAGTIAELVRVSDALSAYLDNVNQNLSLRLGEECISPRSAFGHYNNNDKQGLQ